LLNLSVAYRLFPPYDDGPPQPTEKRGRHGTHSVPSYISIRHHSSAKEITSHFRSIEVNLQIAAYGSKKMCRACGAIPGCSKPFCLECGALLPAV